MRKAVRDDISRVIAFYRSVSSRTPEISRYARWVYGQHPTDEMLSAYILAQNLYLYEETEGQIAGAVVVTPFQGEEYHAVPWSADLKDEDVAVLHLLAVSPEIQGKGVAGKMIEEAILLAKFLGKHALRLDALATNLPARRLYLRKGFVCRGTRRLYAANTGMTDFDFYELIF